MTDKIFVDTNILVYAHDLDAGEKHRVARDLIMELWEAQSGVLSTQVLQEYYVSITRKVPHPLDIARARRTVGNYCQWNVVVNDARIILQATEIQEAYKISFWDALIVSAAFAGNAATILTEDLNHGQYIEGIYVKNPFVTPQ